MCQLLKCDEVNLPKI